MHPRTRFMAWMAAATLTLAACTSSPNSGPEPSPSTSSPQVSVSPQPTESTSPAPTEVPLAVVSAFTRLDPDITLAELVKAKPLVPCDVNLNVKGLSADGCVAADALVDTVLASPDTLALLPAGLVEPRVKVLAVDGADLFGDATARAKTYPVMGTATGMPTEWTQYSADTVVRLMSVGDSCPARGTAWQALTAGRGWPWIFNGGTVAYDRIRPNPAPPGQAGHGYMIVDAHPSGNAGAVATLISSADVTLMDFECPVGGPDDVDDGMIFTVAPHILPRLKKTLGVDVVTMAANHQFDGGTEMFLDTLKRFRAVGIEPFGGGATLQEALNPATVKAGGTTFAFVGFNEVTGTPAAAASTPGVAWLTAENITAAVGRAQKAADVVICVPQWWGGAEYHDDMLPGQMEAEKTMYEAGCHHILGHGTHWPGPLRIHAGDGDGGHVTVASQGNFLFGQQWSQETSEGFLAELVFTGSRLRQLRLHPYFMYLQSQAGLTDSVGDGRHVLGRVFRASDLNVKDK